MSKKKVREMRFTRRLTDVWIVTDRSTGDHTGLAEDNLGLRFAPPATLALWTSPTTSPSRPPEHLSNIVVYATQVMSPVTEYQLSTINQ
jgi:hypothetical protein